MRGTFPLLVRRRAVNMPFAHQPAFVRGLGIGPAGEQGLSEGLDVALAMMGVLVPLVGSVAQGSSSGRVLLGMAPGNPAIARGGPVSPGRYVPPSRGCWPRGAPARLVTALLLPAGFRLFVVPGAIAMPGLWLWPVALLGERRGVLEALRRSGELTDGHEMDILVWALARAALSFVVALPTCGLGAVRTLPVPGIGLSLARLGLIEHGSERLPGPG